ncbi:MAG TPA: hypothetical protein PLH36_11005, partial [Armatimonadota bacterium]|nr:hypothetical protein [Armatimonadota bacterium]
TELEKEAEAIPPQIATIRQEVSIVLEGFSARVEGIQEEHAARIAEVKRQLEETRQSMEAQLQALSAQWSERLKRVTLVPLPRWQAYLVGGLGMVAAAAAGAAAKAFGLF